MGFKLISQIALIVTALIIIFTFVTPTLATIKSNQDELFKYKEAVQKASQFNVRLQELISIRDSFPQEDMASLELFLPTQIDSVTVMKDIESIFASKNVIITELTATEEVTPVQEVALEGIEAAETAPETSYQDFEMTFNATYPEVKDILMLLEANKTLLEVMEFSFDVYASQGDAEEVEINDDQYLFLLILRTYGLTDSAI